jgi:DUF4097 and DUF4098 domain-containing protein YvlB
MEERERILKLLEDGKINADEAAKLLNALGETYRWGPRHWPGPDLGERIARKVELRLKDLPDMIERCVPFMGTGEEKELQFNPKDRLVIKAVSGDVTIKGDDERKIRIKLRNGHKVSETENELLLKTMSGDLDITVIKSQNVDIKTAAGDVSASNLDGTLTFRCGSGDANLKQISGDVRVALGSGDLDGTQISGEVSVALGSGDANLNFAECKGGKVEVGSGDITLTLPEEANLEITLVKPRKGSILSDFEFETPEDVEEFKFTIGKPKAKLYVKTKHGDITIRKRSEK